MLAVEIVSDYLTPSAAQKLLQAHSVNASDLTAKAATANLKRKTDWEQELEVSMLSLLGFVCVLFTHDCAAADLMLHIFACA